MLEVLIDSKLMEAKRPQEIPHIGSIQQSPFEQLSEETERERQRDRETERQRERERETERQRDREREQNMIKPYQPEDVLDIDIAVK